MTQELSTQDQTTDLVVPTGSWGSEGLTSQDITIPKLLLQQPLSNFAVGGTAKAGDICDSLSGEVMGGKGKPVEIIPIMLNKVWVVEKQDGSRWSYVRSEPVTPENVGLDAFTCWSENIKGKDYTCRRNMSMNYFVLMASQVSEPDAFPYVASFRRTSMKAGRAVGTHFTKMSMCNKPPAARTLKLACHLETNDLGSFWVWDIEGGRVSTPEEITKAYAWYKTLGKGTHKVDESDLKEDEASPTTGAKPNVQF